MKKEILQHQMNHLNHEELLCFPQLLLKLGNFPETKKTNGKSF